jgi:hypothetical protein
MYSKLGSECINDNEDWVLASHSRGDAKDAAKSQSRVYPSRCSLCPRRSFLRPTLYNARPLSHAISQDCQLIGWEEWPSICSSTNCTFYPSRSSCQSVAVYMLMDACVPVRLGQCCMSDKKEDSSRIFTFPLPSWGNSLIPGIPSSKDPNLLPEYEFSKLGSHDF